MPEWHQFDTYVHDLKQKEKEKNVVRPSPSDEIFWIRPWDLT